MPSLSHPYINIYFCLLYFIFTIKYSCFTLLCLFILYSKVNQLSVSSVQSLSRVRLLATAWTIACQASLSITNSQNLLKLMSVESIQSVMPSNHLIFCHLLLLLPSIFPSIRVFSKESVHHQMVKVLEFQLQHKSYQRIFRTDFLEDGLV